MKVSVLMSVHNGERFLQESVNSILCQEYDDFELILVDDASTDDTRGLIRSYQDPRIVPVFNEKNIGIGASMCRAYEFAHGQLIAKMDADDICMPFRLGDQIDSLKSTGRSVNLAQAEIFHEGSDGEVCQLWPDRQRSDYEIEWEGLQNQIYGCHPALMMTREAYEISGGYNPDFPVALDYDLFDRVVAAGYLFSYTKRVGLRYRRHATQVTTARVAQQESYARKVVSRALLRLLPTISNDDLSGWALLWGRTPLEGDRGISSGMRMLAPVADALAKKNNLAKVPNEIVYDVVFKYGGASRCPLTLTSTDYLRVLRWGSKEIGLDEAIKAFVRGRRIGAQAFRNPEMLMNSRFA